MRRSLKAFTVSVLILIALAPQLTNVQAAEAKWLVLRHETTSNCWIAKAIRIGGAFATGSALIAGGPYATEEEARARVSELALNGTCRTK